MILSMLPVVMWLVLVALESSSGTLAVALVDLGTALMLLGMFLMILQPDEKAPKEL